MGYTLHRKRNKQNKKGETIKKQTLFLWVNIIGGIAVLGGYAYALAINPETRNALWGGIPESWKPLYTFSMFTSAIGYLYAIYYLVFTNNWERVGGVGTNTGGNQYYYDLFTFAFNR